MSSSMSTNMKYALAGVGALALGFGLYYLSKEDDASIKLDKTKYTKERLKKFIGESLLEYVCIVCRNYNLMLKVKEANDNKFANEDMNQLKMIIEKEIERKTVQLCKDYTFGESKANKKATEDGEEEEKEAKKEDELDVETLENWIKMYENEKFILDSQDYLDKLLDDVFKRQKIEHLNYEKEIPEEFTKEKYIAVFTKIWATIRHDIWKEMQTTRKENRNQPLTQEQFDDIYETVHDRFETIRAEVYELVMDTELDNKEKAREIMQKAYVTYSTVSSVTNADGTAVRSRWADQVQATAAKHSEYCKQMQDGAKPYESIDKDPRLSHEADEKYDLKSMAAYQPGL